MGQSKSGKPKTHKGLKKRIRVTARGKVKRGKAYRGHLLSGRPSKQMRKLKRGAILGKADTKRTLEKLGLGSA